jgi:hypothetical protein
MTNQPHLPNLETAAVGSPITRLGISFFPIYLMGADLPDISTGQDSGLVIKELENPSVPSLLAHNPTRKPVLVVEGQHFLGGKQNRTINGTVLVPAMTKLEIPVSCLEQGRWGRAQAYRQGETFAPRTVRMRKESTVNHTMRQSGSRQGDQGAVWSEVDSVLQEAAARSETSAASVIDEVYRRESRRGEALVDLVGLGPLPRQSGIAVTHGRWVAAIELFGSPELLRAHWEALIRSYLLESVRPLGRPSPTRVLRILRRFGSLKSQNAPGVGLGMDQRVEDRRIVGQALTLDGVIVHGSAFARTSDESVP